MQRLLLGKVFENQILYVMFDEKFPGKSDGRHKRTMRWTKNKIQKLFRKRRFCGFSRFSSLRSHRTRISCFPDSKTRRHNTFSRTKNFFKKSPQLRYFCFHSASALPRLSHVASLQCTASTLEWIASTARWL